jgi:hypothetical protein
LKIENATVFDETTVTNVRVTRSSASKQTVLPFHLVRISRQNQIDAVGGRDLLIRSGAAAHGNSREPAPDSHRV